MVTGVSLSSLVFTAYIAMFLGMGSYIIFSTSQNGAVICCIIGSILSFFVYKINKYILEHNEYEDIFELSRHIFKRVGKLLNYILAFSFFIIFCFGLSNITEFLSVEYLPETNVASISIIVLIALVYLSSKRVIDIIRVNQIFSIISFCVLVLDILGTINAWNITNIEPLWDIGTKSFIFGSMSYALISVVPFSLLGMFGKRVLENDSKNKVKNKENSKEASSILDKMYIFVNVVEIILVFASTLILGREYLGVFKYPEYVALKQFTLFNFLERIENILAIEFFFCSFSFLSVIVSLIVKLTPKTIKREICPIFVAICGCIITSLVFKNTLVFNFLVSKTLVPICLIGILLPIVCIYVKLKMLEKVNKNS